MTLDEAIERYKDNAEYERTHGSLQGCLEFKQLAEWLKELKEIKEQQSCEDAVSREKIEKLKRWRFSYDTNTTISKSDLFIKLADIRALPSVQSKSKTGHWIDHPQGEQCSECELYVIDHHNDNYCPYCGSYNRSEITE